MDKKLIEEYSKIVTDVEVLLHSNQEWKGRYRSYIEFLGSEMFIERIKKAKKHFQVPQQFGLYMSVTMATNNYNPNSKKTIFELRFHGQSVGTLTVIKDKVKLSTKENTNLMKLSNVYHTKESVDWKSSKAAKIFRSEFKRLNTEMSHGQSEHMLESELLGNYSQKTFKGKEIQHIQPIKMAKTVARFQMPTPLAASKAKDGEISYSGKDGGGIDMLVRYGQRRCTRLTILELKDENSKNELSEKAIKQAIAYATFIHELLRCEDVANGKWWKFFGFEGPIPTKLILNAVIVMPDQDDAETGFAGIQIPIPNSDDVIELHYIYRNQTPGEKSRTSLST